MTLLELSGDISSDRERCYGKYRLNRSFRSESRLYILALSLQAHTAVFRDSVFCAGMSMEPSLRWLYRPHWGNASQIDAGSVSKWWDLLIIIREERTKDHVSEQRNRVIMLTPQYNFNFGVWLRPCRTLDGMKKVILFPMLLHVCGLHAERLIRKAIVLEIPDLPKQSDQCLSRG